MALSTEDLGSIKYNTEKKSYVVYWELKYMGKVQVMYV